MSDGRWKVTGSPVREDRPKNWVEDDGREFLIQCFRRPERYAEVLLDEEMPPVIARLLNEAEVSTPSPPAPCRKPDGDRLASPADALVERYWAGVWERAAREAVSRYVPADQVDAEVAALVELATEAEQDAEGERRFP